MPSSSLKITGLSKRYGDVVALAPTDLEVAQGEFLTLLGPSGSGKTTLLSLIAGLATPDGGQLLIDGKDATYGAPYERDIGMVFQNYALFPHMTVAENIVFPLKMRKVDAASASRAPPRRSSWCACRTSRSASRASSRAASSSASRSPAASSTGPPSC
jgi:putative spermidine/putrescine transport system ATP-binding protein